MTLEQSLSILEPFTLGETIRCHEECADIRADLMKSRRDFTEEELPEETHEERLKALKTIQSHLSR